MPKIPHDRDTHTAHCPRCRAAFSVRKSRDCACLWWCRPCLDAMRRTA